jgi:hypothetical protein
MFKKTLFMAAATAGLAFAMPQAASAQSAWPIVSGDYVEVGMIKVDDGHALDYANFLAGQWRKSSDFSRAQGWITDYQIWYNTNPRSGEGDIYLVTWFPKMSTPAEDDAREAAYSKHMAMTEAQMQAGSAQRAEYRKNVGSMMFRVQNFRK